MGARTRRSSRAPRAPYACGPTARSNGPVPTGTSDRRPVALPPDDAVYVDGYAATQRHFIEGLITGAEHETRAADNLKTMDVDLGRLPLGRGRPDHRRLTRPNPAVPATTALLRGENRAARLPPDRPDVKMKVLGSTGIAMHP